MSQDEYEIRIYANADGTEPFKEWLDSLRENKTKLIVLRRMQRLRVGLFGDCKILASGDGIHELRIDFGPGYRVYFAKVSSKVLLLLAGGDKSTQQSDIKNARMCLLDYRKNA